MGGNPCEMFHRCGRRGRARSKDHSLQQLPQGQGGFSTDEKKGLAKQDLS